MLTQYIVDPAELPWKASQTQGITFQCQVLLNGLDGGPEALRFRFDPCPSVYAHMHLTSQFQLLLRGTMDFPKQSMKLRPTAVHYTDHNVPYGPFSVGAGHEVVVLHPKRGGLISMANKTARKQINLPGREFTGMEKISNGFQSRDARVRARKFLFRGQRGRRWQYFNCPRTPSFPSVPPRMGGTKWCWMVLSRSGTVISNHRGFVMYKVTSGLRH